MSARIQAQEQFRSFASRIRAGGRVSVIGHSDVDGLAATAIMARALEQAGFVVSPYITRKGENAWSDSVLREVSAQSPAALVVVDLGSRLDTLIPHVPTVLIDHHKATGVPVEGTLISGYDVKPTPSSGLLAYWCAEAIGADPSVAWLAAASMLADYGNANTFSETKAAAKAVGTATLRRITTLLNAPRRTSSGDANPTLQLLLTATGPASLLQPPNEQILLDAKQEVDEALLRARKTAPKFALNVALILIHEGCQVHPLVAQTWQNRLRNHIVICANTGYLPGRVNFAVRTATSQNLLEFLQKHKPPGAGEDYGRGHDKATGGSLTLEDWNVFLASLGFVV